jgi:hypothetical protein
MDQASAEIPDNNAVVMNDGPELPDMPDMPNIASAAKGGRIERKQGGGSGGMSIMDAVKVLMRNGATPQEAITLASIMRPESGGNAAAHNPECKNRR